MPNGKILTLLGLWGIICYCLFPLPINLVICFGGIIMFALFIPSPTKIEKEDRDFTIAPPPAKTTQSKKVVRDKNKPKIRIELRDP